jgi:hypothetical protein
MTECVKYDILRKPTLKHVRKLVFDITTIIIMLGITMVQIRFHWVIH